MFGCVVDKQDTDRWAGGPWERGWALMTREQVKYV